MMMKPKAPIEKDYKYLVAGKAQTNGSRPRLVWHMGWILGIAAALTVVTIATKATSEMPTALPSDTMDYATDTLTSSAPSAEPAEIPQIPAGPEITWQEARISNGDNLAWIFKKQNISPQVLHNIMQADPLAKNLKQIKPGQLLRFQFVDGDMQELHYVMDETRKLIIRSEDGGFAFTEETQEYETRTQLARGSIDSSLFLSAQAVGLSDNITMELAHIFGWDIDFALDIRSGDEFTVVYEELFLKGEKIKNGNILAAEFRNNGKSLRALRYTDPKGNTGYFAPDGKNMRKTFLRTPVDFSRISSYFGRRKHPVLNRMRVHKGVDYASPRGTPIKATGNGKIVHRGRKGGYGKTVVIQHGSGYRTLYAHMNNYRRGQRRGKSVKQGDVIGFVGSTGLATGPHLHYEFLVNGVHRNPLRVKLPDAKPLKKSYRQDFQSKILGMSALLDIVTDRSIAMNQP